MDIHERIARFEKMASDDADNDMAHFSLAGAYAQAGRHDDAAASYLRCIELNEDMSKAYQLAGAALVEAGRTDDAKTTLRRGYLVASAKGDLMPRNAIAELLGQLGEEPPEIDAETKAKAEAARKAAAGGFMCKRTGRPGTQLPEPPMRGPVGKWIHENISAETWRAWIGQGTKVINELRLDFSREQDQETYDRHMREYLGIDEALLKELGSETAKKN
ncbi:MAG: hypothetical protein EA379_10945 [Phycisphaerales bacterium]|nr:MAG: hypothetical protein EA379_10945 [Phycisphaerales bacterium]